MRGDKVCVLGRSYICAWVLEMSSAYESAMKGFCIAKWGIKLSSGAEKGLPAETASSSTERAEISKAPLSLVKWDRYLLLGYRNEALGTCHWLFSDVGQITYFSSHRASGSPPLK